jgi:acetylornithine deacetylase/succinyl-diaminopimelate desuccinylase family protein
VDDRLMLEPELADRIVAQVDGLADELVAAVADAVRIPSVTPRYPGQDYAALVGGESQVSRFVAQIYRLAGAEVELFALEQGRENAVGVIAGSGGGQSLIFNGHVDVVPPGDDAWRGGSPWSGLVEDGRVWGRGSCDMKGGVLAQAFAAVALTRAGVRLRGDLLLEAVVGEEMMEHQLGTTACIERGFRADAAVVAEPSGPPDRLAVVPVTSGILSFTLAVEGKATHAAMRGETITQGGYGAEVGVSAIDKAIELYDVLRELEREWGNTKRHPLYRPGHFAIYPGVVVGGPTSGLVPFFIADAARLEYVVIHHPDEPADDVRAEIEHHVQGAASLDPWLVEHPPTVTWNHAWPPSVVDVEHPIVAAASAAHERASGEPARLRGFAAVDDASFLTAAGIPAITYGPGDLRVAHAADEHVEIAELVTATRAYALLAAAWCG